MSDDPQIVRDLLLLRALCARRYGMSVREMAHELGVVQQTIRRALRRFQRVGIPVAESTGDHGRKTWQLANNGHVPPLCLTYDEAVVMCLGRQLLEPLAGTQFWEAAHSAMRKIRATLSEPALKYLEEMFPRLFHSTRVGYTDYSGKAEIIDGLTVAIEDCKAVHITYRSQRATEAATRDVYPYGFTRHKGSLYLVAFAPEHDKIRHYKLDRIEAIESSSVTFQRPPDFSMKTHLAGSFGIYDGDDVFTVVIKFLPAVARYVRESKWHDSETLTEQRDGSLLATFQLSSTVEIKSWALSFGGSAIVLEPAALRAEIAAELEQLRDAYQDQPLESRTAAVPHPHRAEDHSHSE